MKHLQSFRAILPFLFFVFAFSSCNDDDEVINFSEEWLSGTWYAQESVEDIRRISISFTSKETINNGKDDFSLNVYEGEIKYVKGNPNINPGQVTYGSSVDISVITEENEIGETIFIQNVGQWTIKVTLTGISEDGTIIYVKAIKKDLIDFDSENDFTGGETFNLSLSRTEP